MKNAESVLVFEDKINMAAYDAWLIRFGPVIINFSNIYNLFAEQMDLQKFSKSVLVQLSKNGTLDAWAAAVVNKYVEQYDNALRTLYMEQAYTHVKQLNENFRLVGAYIERQNSTYNTIPTNLLEFESLPEMENGKFIIDEAFLNFRAKHFETRVATESKEYELLNKIRAAYNELYPILIVKGIIDKPFTFGRAEGLQDLVSMERFLIKRNDGTVTINEDTLNRLQA